MTDQPSSFPLNIPVFSAALEDLLHAISPRGPRRRTFEERERWDRSARILAKLPVQRRVLHWRARPYLTVHPEREIAYEVNGVGQCPACREVYSPTLVEWILSPAFLRAQRWAHRHNAERHPRRWLRSQHFQASIPVEVRERAEA